MKNQIKTVIFILTLVALTTGCAQQPQGGPITIATATTGGVWYPIGTTLADMITRYVPGTTASAQATGGAIENLKLLTTGKMNMVFAYDYHVAWLNAGQMPSVADGKKNVRLVLGLYEHPLHVITRQDTGIKSLLDLKGKRVSTGVVDSGVEEQASYVFKALGIDWDKDITREKLSINDSAAALKEGKLDAFFWSGAVPSETAPTAAITGLATDPNVGMVILPISGNEAETIIQANPAVFHRTAIKKDEYPGMAADVETLGVTAVLAVMDTFPASQLTAVLNMIFDHKNELTSVWKGAANLTPEKSMGLLAPETRQYLHPAAEAVFKQRGASK